MDLGGWSLTLAEERVIGLQSASEEVVISAAGALVGLDVWREHRREALNAGVEEDAASLGRKPLDPRPTVLIVDARDSPAFVESLGLMSTREYLRNRYAENLKYHGTAVLVLFDSREHSGEHFQNFNFKQWNIPFLRPLLEAHAFSPSEAKALELELEAQRKAGFWGEPTNDQLFCRRVRELLGGGSGAALRARVRELAEKEASALAAEESDNFDYLCELFRSGEPLQRAILFAATFFPGLGPDDFDHVLKILVGAEVTKVSVEKSFKTKKGKEKIITLTEERPSSEVWEERPDQYLTEASLRTVTSDRGREAIAFESNAVRDGLQTFIRRDYAMYLRQRFVIIREKALLFDPDISEDLAARAVVLWAEMVEADRHKLGKDWLVEVAGSLPAGFRIAVSEGTDPEEVQQLAEAHARQIAGYHRLVFRRLADLVREMLKRPSLQDKVAESLNRLLAVRGEWAQLSALELVLGLTRRLRFAPEFDAVHWLKRVMDESRLEGQFAAYRELLHDLEQAGGRIYEVLEQVRAWLPTPDRPSHRFSPSNGFGLRLLLDYGLATALRHQTEKWGEWPSTYPLFADLAEGDASAARRLSLLAEWLFHDQQGAAIGDDELAWHMRADLVELWWAILLGAQKLGNDDVRLEIGRTLLVEILRRTGLEGQRRLIGQWRSNRRAYEARFEALRHDHKAESDEMWLRRTLSVHLDREFNSLWKKRRSERKRESA